VPPSRRKVATATVGRWSLFRDAAEPGAGTAPAAAFPEDLVEFVARRLLERTGVVFRRTLVRERIPVPWRDLVRRYRNLELRGEVRGGRFVTGFDGEQFALPEAVPLLRAVRRRGPLGEVSVSAADPLNFAGILTPGERVPPATRKRVAIA